MANLNKILLSDGTSTTFIDWIIDSIRLSASLDPNSIPNMSLGMDKIVLSIKKSDIESILTDRVSKIITDLNKKHSLNLSLSSLNVQSSTTYSFVVSLNNSNYEISANYNK